MIQLKTDSLRRFLKKAAFIERNELLPVLSNLKLETIDGKHFLTKNNLNAVCVGSIDSAQHEPHDPILLDERIFSSFVGSSRLDEIAVEMVEGKILLIEGKSKIELPVVPHTDFPTAPEVPTSDPSFTFKPEHMKVMEIAEAFVTKSETAGAFQYIHLYPDMVFAFHNNYFFVNTNFTGLPNTSLRPEEVQIMTDASVEQLEFWDLDRFHIFREPGYTFTFTKTEVSPPKVAQVVERLKLPGKDFEVPKGEVVDFCQIANIVSESDIALSTMKKEGGFMMLKLIDANYSRQTERMVMVTGDFDDFNFNSRLTISPLKAIPYETLKCKTNQNCLIVTGENEYFCFIGMTKS